MNMKIVADDVKRGDISIELLSPSGTKSSMISERRNDRFAFGFDTKQWPLMSTHFWGENPSGSWTIKISAREKPLQAFDGEFSVIGFETSDVLWELQNTSYGLNSNVHYLFMSFGRNKPQST